MTHNSVEKVNSKCHRYLSVKHDIITYKEGLEKWVYGKDNMDFLEDLSLDFGSQHPHKVAYHWSVIQVPGNTVSSSGKNIDMQMYIYTHK